MKLSVVGSSSKGNCYVLHNDSESLIIEAGCPISEVLKAINYDVPKVTACIVSHEHGDHSKNVHSLQKYGIKCYMSKGTFEGLKKFVVTPEIIKSGDVFKVGGFTIKAFSTHHDCNEPLGFLISHREIGLLLFAIDTCYLDYVFPGLTNIMIECNYSDDILERNVEEGIVHPKVMMHIKRSHMSIQTCIKTLQANKLDEVNNIILLHLSKDNADSIRFKKDVMMATAKNVIVAEKNMCVDINKTPFG